MIVRCCRVVSYVDILKLDYATISLKGVTRNRADDETDFTAMERFEYEYRQFHKLRNVSASCVCCCLPFRFTLSF